METIEDYLAWTVPDLTEDQVARVEAKLGDGVICDQCGCTLATFARQCSAPMHEPCPGFKAIEAARRP